MGLKTVSKMSQVTSVTNEKSAWGTGVKSAERTLDLLELLADSEEALSLSQIAHRLDLPKSSAHGLLKTLERRGFARLAGGGYQLGLKALQVGLKYSDASRLLEQSEAIVLRLNRVTNETVHLATLEGPDVVFLQIKPSTQPLRLLSAVGLRQSAHVSSVGKAQLATLTDEEVRAIYVDRILTALTPKTLPPLKPCWPISTGRGPVVTPLMTRSLIWACSVLAAPSGMLRGGPWPGSRSRRRRSGCAGLSLSAW